MIPYIVKCNVTVTPYMGEPYDIDDVRIVMAEDADQARDKYEKYWHDKTDEYSIYYNAYGSEVMETVL